VSQAAAAAATAATAATATISVPRYIRKNREKKKNKLKGILKTQSGLSPVPFQTLRKGSQEKQWKLDEQAHCI